MRKFLLFIVLTFTCVMRLAAQESDLPRFRVRTNLVTVPVSVFDEHGNLLEGLKKEDFRLWEDQAPQEIRGFGTDEDFMSVVLVLDTSPTSKSELSKIKNAAEIFAQTLQPRDRISLITFDDRVSLILDWTSDKKKVKKALGKITLGVRTALYDAMYLAASEQLQGVNGRKAIILLTDCLNNESRVGFGDAVRAIVQSQAAFYVVSKTAMVKEDARMQRRVVILNDIYRRLFGEESNRVDEYFMEKEKEMWNLAVETGGRCFFPTNYDAIPRIYTEIARELKNKYYLTYVSNQTLQPDSWHHIAVECLRPVSEIIYRNGYYYLPKTSSKIFKPSLVRGSL